MLLFIGARLVQAVFTLWAVTIIVFTAARLTGSPEFIMMPVDARAEDLAAFRQLYGLDRPLPEQYLRWLGLVLHGDLGNGIHFAGPISALVLKRLGNSVPLAAVAMAMTILLGIPLGVLAAAKRGKLWDRVATAVGVGGQAIPSFWLGMVLVLIFAVNLRLLPATGAASWKSYLLPGFTIGYFMTAGAMRLVRSSMLETLDTEYIKFARAKGVPEHLVLWKHALRNALVPALTFLGYMFGAIIAASITVETVFSWPGIGSLIYEGILARDFPVVQGVVLVWSSIMIGVNLLVDMLYLVVDPRVRIRA
jgi:peptide/nickel transport system permease protein